MKYLLETDHDGIASAGDPIPGHNPRSEFSTLGESIRLEAEHDAVSDGEDPKSLAVQLDIAVQIAALRLRMYAEESGLSQGQVAAALGISRGTVNRILRGKTPIEYKTYRRLGLLEELSAILACVDSMASDKDKALFESLIDGVNIADPYSKALYCLGAVFGPMAYSDFKDNGSMTPIPAEADAPEALSLAIRKGVTV